MNTKIKIQKVLPYWLIFQLFLTIAVVFPYFMSASDNELPTPKVLGDRTERENLVRGDLNNEYLDIKAISDSNINTSSVIAESFLVFNLDTGKVILEKNANQKMAIASITKLMTGLVAYENLDLNSYYEITNNAQISVKPILGLKPGDKVKAIDVLSSMIIGSDNDAALALADFVEKETGKEFKDLMNLKAQELAMFNSSFSNPMGFDSQNNFSTAYDLKILIQEVQKLSVFTDLGRRVTYNFFGQMNTPYFSKATNTLLKKNLDLQAIKTGFTNEAGGSMATKFIFKNKPIIILVLSSSNRELDTLKLKKIVEDNFE